MSALARNWEGLAKKDPLWAICTCPGKKREGWNAGEFFSSGEQEVDMLFRFFTLDERLPDKAECLDFGCGAGRLTRALSNRFDHVTGVDISPTMIHIAREMNKDASSPIRFVEYHEPSLALFRDAHFSMAISLLVLQHMPQELSLFYLGEMMRVLKPGGLLMVQIATDDIRKQSVVRKFKEHLRLRERLALMGMGKGFSMRMFVLAPGIIRECIIQNGGFLLAEVFTNHTDPAYTGNMKIIKEEESIDYVSRLYLVQKVSRAVD